MWGAASARQLAGRTIRLRFFLGGSTIYGVTAKPQPEGGATLQQEAAPKK
jgi:hypothetical protein